MMNLLLRAARAGSILLAATVSSRARAQAGGAPPPEPRPAVEGLLPPALLQPGPLGLLWWQWLALPSLVLVCVALGWLLGYLTRTLLGRLAARTRTSWDDQIIDRIAGPLTALWAVGLFSIAHGWLSLGGGFEAGLVRVLRAAAYLSFFWAGFRLLDVAFQALGSAPWTRTGAGTGLAGLLPLGRKVAKVLLLAMGVVAVLNELGFKVASLLAGLGIGGIALALAAQKTVENLFGSVAIGVDQPFRVGDFVKVEDFQGTVESIGMRSTRFRTLDRTVITMPNGKLADSRAETFAARDRIRLYTNLGLARSTTAAQLRAVLAGIEELLVRHPRIHAESPPGVRFNEIRESSLNVEIAAMFATADWNEFTLIRQELYLAFLEVVERAGTALAFPTRTVQLVDAKGGGPARSAGEG
ncbi:MAG TPA: mechanosensitive ion channel family protein [Anaeromyxobacter sp.]|nr:mechanosensitive ion channel family protein [Anaeromyxobacter sp.]